MKNGEVEAVLEEPQIMAPSKRLWLLLKSHLGVALLNTFYKSLQLSYRVKTSQV
jgi:hypothetical protein